MPCSACDRSVSRVWSFGKVVGVACDGCDRSPLLCGCERPKPSVARNVQSCLTRPEPHFCAHPFSIVDNAGGKA